MAKKKNVDRMSNKERIRSLMLDEPIDRVPFIPFKFSQSGIVVPSIEGSPQPNHVVDDR